MPCLVFQLQSIPSSLKPYVFPMHWCCLQVEMDFKAECTAGDEIDCFGMSLTPEGDTSKQQFLHLLRKGGTETEVWRARTTWVPVNSSGDFCCSSSSNTAAEGVTLSSPSSNGVASNGVAAAANGAAVPKNGTAAASAAGTPAGSSSSSSLPSSSSSGHSAAAAGSNGTAAAAAAAPASSSTGGGGGLFGAVAALFGQSAANKSDK
jgi:hypothetical protein